MNVLNRRWSFRVGVGVLGTLLAIQLVPYGRDHSNPPLGSEPPWDSPTTRALAKQACFDCHSNETEWPAYASVAPASWLVQRDVDEGRAVLNFSEWQRPQEEATASRRAWRRPWAASPHTTQPDASASECVGVPTRGRLS